MFGVSYIFCDVSFSLYELMDRLIETLYLF